MDSKIFNPESFRAWKDHPSNQPFFQFLKDQQARLIKEWSETEGEMHPWGRPKVLILGELADLRWSDVAAFYGIEDEK